MTDLDSPELIAELEDHERRLVFRRFDNDDAWRLGSAMVAAARERGLPLVIDIHRGGQQLFFAALPGSTPDNAEWVRRKVNVVNRFAVSSFLFGRRLAAQGRQLSEALGVAPIDYAPHVGIVGTVTVSGLPQADDHAFVVEQIELHLTGTG